MKFQLVVICGTFTCMACNDSPKMDEKEPGTASDNLILRQDTIINTNPADSVPKNIQFDSVIHLAFAPDSISVSVKGHVDKKGEPVICYLPVTVGKKLTASVVPDNKKATIRFSHIYFPNGKSDGPFGNTLKYDLTQRGTYKIYISPNMMAGDPVSSDFLLKVKVE